MFRSKRSQKYRLIEGTLQRWGRLFGKGSDIISIGLVDATGEVNFSQTNVPTAGADEPDLAETDGRGLYSLARDEPTVRGIVGELRIPGFSNDLQVHGYSGSGCSETVDRL